MLLLLKPSFIFPSLHASRQKHCRSRFHSSSTRSTTCRGRAGPESFFQYVLLLLYVLLFSSQSRRSFSDFTEITFADMISYRHKSHPQKITWQPRSSLLSWGDRIQNHHSSSTQTPHSPQFTPPGPAQRTVDGNVTCRKFAFTLIRLDCLWKSCCGVTTSVRFHAAEHHDEGFASAVVCSRRVRSIQTRRQLGCSWADGAKLFNRSFKTSAKKSEHKAPNTPTVKQYQEVQHASLCSNNITTSLKRGYHYSTSQTCFPASFQYESAEESPL